MEEVQVATREKFNDAKLASIQRVGLVVLKSGSSILWEFFAEDTKAIQTRPTMPG